jgi:Spy/CpxP family protein refolding chaperone
MNETPEQREARRKYHREYDRKRREAETPEQREARLIKQREYNSKRKAIHDH